MQQNLEKKIKQIEKRLMKLKKELQDGIKTRHIEAHSIWIRDENGALRIELAVFNDRAIINVCDGNPGEEKVRGGLFLFPDGKCSIILLDKRERIRLEVAMPSSGTPSIKCYDTKGHIIFKIPHKRRTQKTKIRAK